jgi:hypothetical protein
MNCERCGYVITANRFERILKMGYDLLCVDCAQVPMRIVVTGKDEYCIPHKFEFDDEDNPMKHGLPYRPGERLCGNRDCVRPVHVVAPLIVKPVDEIEQLIEKIKKQKVLIPWDSPIWNDVRKPIAGV